MIVFKIRKKTGTYSDLLEAYGLANLLNEIFDRFDSQAANSITIRDKNLYFEIETRDPVSDQMIDQLSYFPIFKFVKQKPDTDTSGMSGYFDYPAQRTFKKERDAEKLKVHNECKGITRKSEREWRLKEIERIYTEEKKIDTELDVYSQICAPNNYPGFDKLYKNFFLHKELFTTLIKEILDYYFVDDYDYKKFDKLIKPYKGFSKQVTAIQLYNPHQGQGVNKIKADGLNRTNFDSSWICESMKISGALSDLICQLVKVGKTYDLKIFVPEYQTVNFSFKRLLIPAFKKYLKGGNTPIKIDVLYVLLLTEKIIEHSGFSIVPVKVKNIVSGLYSVYQKDLGQNKAVVNIGFLQIPDFIEISSKEEKDKWLEILKEQRDVIGNINEQGSSIRGLQIYRNFISGSDLQSFLDFSFWYAQYLTSKKLKNEYARAFSIETLNKFYNSMDTNNLPLSEIINNSGFKAVAYAIRKSTVTLLINKKDAEYDIRYGVAQLLQSKSKSKEDLAEFIGDFVSFYNSENAMKSEKNIKFRRNYVKEDELSAFYLLLDKYSQKSKLIGALLASYGFALPAKEAKNQEPDDEVDSESSGE
jgi:hypothetical protein